MARPRYFPVVKPQAFKPEFPSAQCTMKSML